FMLGCWEDLRAQLEPGKFWQSHDRLKAIRLLGRQPLDAIEDRRVAEIFVASHALNPVEESPFDDLLSDMGTTALARYRKDVRAQWPDLVSIKDTAQCRQILTDLADRNIEQLKANLAEHEASADANAERTFTRLSVDKSPDGQRLRAYHMKCWSAFVRGVETFRKYQGKKRAEGRDRKDEYAGMMAKDEGRRIADFGRWAPGADASDHVPDGSYGAGDRMSPRGENRENVTNEAKFDESVIVIQNEEPVAVAANSGVDAGLDKPEKQPGNDQGKEELVTDVLASPTADGVSLSDGTSALASVALSDGITPLAASELDAGTGDAAGNTGIARELTQNLVGRIGNPSDAAFADLFPRGPSRDVSNADAVADSDDRMSPPRGENSQNVTNEAKFDDSVIVIQNEECVAVAANSGVDSGLDKREEQPGRAEGKEEGLNQESQNRPITEASPHVSVSDIERCSDERIDGEKSVTDVTQIPAMV
ncbi:MAG: hypothetical protein ACHRXM_38885, partial [Isosphaerales bacterium]